MTEPDLVLRRLAYTNQVFGCSTSDCGCEFPDTECECPITCLRCWSEMWSENLDIQPEPRDD
jgi:hypothetical protein